MLCFRNPENSPKNEQLSQISQVPEDLSVHAASVRTYVINVSWLYTRVSGAPSYPVSQPALTQKSDRCSYTTYLLYLQSQ